MPVPGAFAASSSLRSKTHSAACTIAFALDVAESSATGGAQVTYRAVDGAARDFGRRSVKGALYGQVAGPCCPEVAELGVKQCGHVGGSSVRVSMTESVTDTFCINDSGNFNNGTAGKKHAVAVRAKYLF